MKPAVVLLSGGLDSSTCLAQCKTDGFAPHALTVLYGQRHDRELTSARAVATALGAVEHRVVSVDLGAIGGSALTDEAIAVPTGRDEASMADAIPVTYVPARNTVFLAIALGWAEVLGSTEIYIGANAIDFSGYPDCRPAFIDAFAALANVATKAGVEGARFTIHAPLLELTKADVVRRAVALGVPLEKTWTCYAPASGGAACGRCDACLLRRKGFAEAGERDPLAYADA